MDLEGVTPQELDDLLHAAAEHVARRLLPCRSRIAHHRRTRAQAPASIPLIANHLPQLSAEAPGDRRIEFCHNFNKLKIEN